MRLNMNEENENTNQKDNTQDVNQVTIGDKVNEMAKEITTSKDMKTIGISTLVGGIAGKMYKPLGVSLGMALGAIAGASKIVCDKIVKGEK